MEPPTHHRRGTCKFYFTTAGCRRGAKCKFSHDASEGNLQRTGQQQNGRRPQAQPNVYQDEYKEWLYQIPRENETLRARPLGNNLSNFLKQAYNLVGKDAGTRQEVITRLASEGGLLRLRELEQLISQSPGRFGSTPRRIFADNLLPLFQILGQEDVMSSLILETPLHTILNFLFGPGGQRAIVLFEFAARSVPLLIEEEGVVATTSISSALEVCLAVMWRIVNLNGLASIMEQFHSITEAFATGLDHVSSSGEDLATMRSKMLLAKIQRRLGIGHELPEVSGPSKAIAKKAVFELRHDAPGWLSDQGPRHDNDSEDIRNIAIMPTALEIQSPRLEYLPTTDPFKLHVLGVEGLLDRHFRLLREDTVGQLRDAVKIEFEGRFGNTPVAAVQRQDRIGARTFVYQNALLCGIKLHKFRGLELVYEFSQPPAVQKMSTKERKAWWESSKRLQVGALVCLLDSRGTPIFCSVQHSGLRQEDDKLSTAKPTEEPWVNVFENPQRAFVTLGLVDTDNASVDLVLGGFVTGTGRGSEVLVEFPGVLLPSFRPTLQALQRMTTAADIPFANVLAPASQLEAQQHEIPPPAYSTQSNFRFDLSCLVGGRALSLSPGEPFNHADLRKHSTLDDKQAAALTEALTRSLTLIQGPPGTGKSFTGIAIIKVLLANAQKARLGPIICVCYTNHALDQLLEHLVDHGVDQIVRVGSRSKSEVLENVSLRNVAGKMEQTKTERASLWQLKRNLETHIMDINAFLKQFEYAATPESIQSYLEAYHEPHAAELFDQPILDEEGWEKVTYRRQDPLQDWLNGVNSGNVERTGVARDIAILKHSSLATMSLRERKLLYAHWVADSRATLKSKILFALEQYLTTRKEHDVARQELDLRCLKEAKVIGVTTTGLARITDLLGRLGSKALLCEEAAEVLEAHMLTTLLPSIEHAILIGDHLQLRPQIQNYNLQSDNPRGKQFSLDMSLFERLVQPPNVDGTIPKVPFSVLQTQRRMHPTIANLIRSTLYPNLKDDKVVTQYPPVCGMRRRLFWFDHRQPEAKQETDTVMATSHSNDFEVAITAALVSHLVRQGTYESKDIAVLTPYLGQFRKLRQALGALFAIVVGDRDLEELEKQGLELESAQTPSIGKSTLLKALRLATIDNFQGEEAKVIVISLVRSNDQNKCGFLRTENRINVALSRAQHGMYIIGNAQTSSTVQMWQDVISQLKDGGNLGDTLELCCPRHPDTNLNVKTPDDFSIFSPEGGCNLKCDKRLQCGHACVASCHGEHLH